nr:MAG TPA: hypothetical protein [Caudoviricetes sp.]
MPNALISQYHYNTFFSVFTDIILTFHSFT